MVIVCARVVVNFRRLAPLKAAPVVLVRTPMTIAPEPANDPLERNLDLVARSASASRLAKTYFWQGEFLAMPGLLPAPVVDALALDASRVTSAAVRRTLPGYKHSSSVAWPTLRQGAPAITALFRSPSFLRLLEGVTDASLVPTPDWDPHACALYHYDRPGDGIGYHYDTSWYRGARYTVLVGLVNRSSAVLSCDLHTREPQRPTRRVQVATDPGTVVVFHGDKVWHRVTPLGEGEERTVLTLQYVTDPRMGPLGRAVSVVKDAVAYFGLRQVVAASLGHRSRPSAAQPPRLGQGRAE